MGTKKRMQNKIESRKVIGYSRVGMRILGDQQKEQIYKYFCRVYSIFQYEKIGEDVTDMSGAAARTGNLRKNRQENREEVRNQGCF